MLYDLQSKFRLRHLALTFALLALGAVLPASAGAATPAEPSLAITSLGSPTHFEAGDQSGFATYVVSVRNVGAAPTDGSSITVTDAIPAGLTLDPTPGSLVGEPHMSSDPKSEISCEEAPGTFTCDAEELRLRPGQRLFMFVPVDIAANAPAVVVNHASVTGGGAADASTSESSPVEPAGATQPGFGFQELSSSFGDADGSPVTQAGAHPYAFQTSFQFNTTSDPVNENPPSGTPRDILSKLPKGMVVNPHSTPVLCTEAEFESSTFSSCPDASAVGVVHTTVNAFGFADPGLSEPVWNLVPPPGSAAAFGFNAAGFEIFAHILGGVNSAGEFELTTKTNDILQYGGISGLSIELWGNPTDASHDYVRGKCAFPSPQLLLNKCTSERLDAPLLTMPSSCSASALRTTISADSWEEPGVFQTGSSLTMDPDGEPLGIEGCNKLEFEPTISSQATTNLADSPTGLEFDLHQPQNECV